MNRRIMGSAIITAATLLAMAVSPATAAPDYRPKLRSAHPNAIAANYTYRGDTVRASFRDRNLAYDKTRQYRVCYRRNWRNVCARKTLDGSDWSRWSLYVHWKWAGKVNGKYVGYIPFKWRAGSDIVAKRRIRIFE